MDKSAPALEAHNAREREAELKDVPLADWIIAKLKTMKDYYEPPTDGRDIVHEIYGWMHVLCFHYEQNRREVKEYGAARRTAKELEAANADLRKRLEEAERVANARGKELDWFSESCQALHADNDRIREAGEALAVAVRNFLAALASQPSEPQPEPAEPRPCPACNGRTYLPDESCPRCGGTNSVPAEPTATRAEQARNLEKWKRPMWGVYPSEGFAEECAALFSNKEEAERYANDEDRGCDCEIFATQVEAELDRWPELAGAAEGIPE